MSGPAAAQREDGKPIMRSSAVKDHRQTSSDELLSLKVWLQLMKCAKSIESAVGGRLRRSHGQSLSRFDVLAQLQRLDGEWVAIGELARLIMAASGNITALLDRMEGEALIERRASPNDRRSFQVRMSAEGRRLFAAMADDHALWIDTALIGMSEADKTRLVDLLVTVRRRFEADAALPDGKDP
jgi:DNA-binding MarR family transcriptional regulator